MSHNFCLNGCLSAANLTVRVGTVALKTGSSKNSCKFLQIPFVRCNLPLNTSCDISKKQFQETLDQGTDIKPRNTRETVNFCPNDTQG